MLFRSPIESLSIRVGSSLPTILPIIVSLSPRGIISIGVRPIFSTMPPIIILLSTSSILLARVASSSTFAITLSLLAFALLAPRASPLSSSVVPMPPISSTLLGALVKGSIE